jgi:hypothetical protein
LAPVGAAKKLAHREFIRISTYFGPRPVNGIKVGTLIAKEGLGPFGVEIKALGGLMRVSAIYRILIRRKFTAKQNLIFHIKSVASRSNDSEVPNV